MTYQSLYRRYRSQTFREVVGQPEVTEPLRTAVMEGRTAHAYLFSGPRGTGKTSTARILAKALNCENVAEGEPCNTCDSCVSITEGKSFDIHELDAASNNKVEDIRDLISKVHLGSPGHTKVYILDEVHMLSQGAENALLKTLEEPPDHVVFVLATTEPHKVVPTIRSRTQQFKFSLIGAQDLTNHLRVIGSDAGFDLDEETLAYVLAAGAGSARDTLSALDAVLVAGRVPQAQKGTMQIAEAVASADAKAALGATQAAIEGGLEPRVIGENLLALLRNGFLVSMGAAPTHLAEIERESAEQVARGFGPARITTAMEILGDALVDARQAPDPRVPIEVAILKLSRPIKLEAGDSGDSDQRIHQLEQQVAQLVAQLESLKSHESVDDGSKQKPGDVKRGGSGTGTRPADRARDTLASSAPTSPRTVSDQVQQKQTNDNPSAPAEADASTPELKPPIASPASVETPVGDPHMDIDTAKQLFSNTLDNISQKARARFKGGHITDVDATSITFSVPNQIHRDRCTEVIGDLEDGLAAQSGRSIKVSIVVDSDTEATARNVGDNTNHVDAQVDSEEEVGPISELEDAGEAATDTEKRVASVFNGAKKVSNEH